MATLQELEQALIKADAMAQQGDQQAIADARAIVAEIDRMRSAQAQQGGGVIDWLAENTPHGGMIRGVGTSLRSAAGAIGDVISGENPTENMISTVLNSPGGAMVETALSAGSGLLASIPAGIAGIGSTVMDGPEAGAGTVESVMSSAYAPRGETAQGMLQPIGRALEGLQNLTGTGAEEIARGFGVEPGSPAAATAYALGATIPDAAGMVTGASLATKVRPKPTRAAAVGQTLDEQFGVSEPQAAITEQPSQTLTQTMPEQRQPVPRKEPKKQAEIRAAIEAGDKEGAGYRVDQRGKIVKDKQAETVIRQGFSDGSVATIKKAPPADKGQMLKMLDIAERGLKNPIERARNRPSDVIGANVMKRWEAVRAANMKARKDINAAAEADLKGKVIDMTDEFDGFVDDMSDLGVTIGEDGVSFKGSQIEGSDIGPIKRVVDRLTYQQDGMALHRLKQYIDSQIDWDNPTKQKPLDQKSVNALKRLRNGINEKLKAQSGDYADANARASETFGVMGDMMDVMGRRFDPSAENAGVYAGQELRKVLSNYQKRADLIAAIDKLDEVSAKYGAKFNDDPINQVVFLNDLERVFGSFADNSLQGVMEKGAGRAINAATGRYGTADVAADIATSVVNRIYGVSEENAIRSMRELLRRDLVTKQ